MRERILGLGLLLGVCHDPSQVPSRLRLLPPPAASSTSTKGLLTGETRSRDPIGEASVAPRSSATPAPLRSLLITIEPPYSAHGHAPLATEMASLARDDDLFHWALGGSSDPTHPANHPGYHPATRVLVDVELLSRAARGSTQRALSITRSAGYWPLRACFETAQRSTPRTERRVRVRLSVGPGGKVLSARNLSESSEPDYVRCIRERVRALDYRPGFGRRVDLVVSVKQWPGHAPTPPRAPALEPIVRLSPEALGHLQSLQPALTACYDRGLIDDSELWGRIALRLKLAEDGSVQVATPIETRFPNARVLECARQVLLRAHLGPGETREFSFAVRLAQGGAPPAPAIGAPAAPAAPAESAPPAPAEPEH